MAARGIIALEFIVDFGRRAERFFQMIGAHERRRTVGAVIFPDGFRDGKKRGGVIQFLLNQLITENTGQFRGRHGLMGAGIQQGSGLVLHIGPEVIPCGRNLGFAEVNLVGDGVVGHSAVSFLNVGTEKKKSCPKQNSLLGQDAIILRCHPA